MRPFYLLIAIVTLASYSHASDLSDESLLVPESCAEFLQSTLGRGDRSSGKYGFKIEKGRDIRSENERIPTYYLRADQIPTGTKFQIAHRNAMGDVIVVFEGVHLGGGRLLRKNGEIGTCVPIACGGFERGEPSQFLFIDLKNKTTDSAFYLPHPIEPAIMDDLKVTMHHISNKPEAYIFDMENLTPGERVHITSTSDSDSAQSSFIASTSGKATTFVAWADSEPPSGEGSFVVRRASGKLVINFPWRREVCILPAPLVIFTIDHTPTASEIEFSKERYLAPTPTSGTEV